MQKIEIIVPDGCEVQIVRKRKEKEPVIRTYQDLIDCHIPISGYMIKSDSTILGSVCVKYALRRDRKLASSEKVAKSMLAMAMISQLMPYYGGAITDEEWNKANMFKYVIKNERGKIWTTYVYTIHDYLAFHTAKQRDNFLKYNERLVKDFLMID